MITPLTMKAAEPSIMRGQSQARIGGNAIEPPVAPPVKIDNGKLLILVADDAVLYRKLTARKLSSYDAHCEEANDGMDIVNKVMDTTKSGGRIYDAIVMDDVMYSLNGPVVAKMLRVFGYTGVIIGLTNTFSQSGSEHFLAQGADKVIKKPLKADDYQSIISGTGYKSP